VDPVFGRSEIDTNYIRRPWKEEPFFKLRPKQEGTY
jgi:hypothetical protein